MLLGILLAPGVGCVTFHEETEWPAWRMVWNVNERVQSLDHRGDPVVTRSMGSHSEEWIVDRDRVLVEIWEGGSTQRLQWSTWILPVEKCVVVLNMRPPGGTLAEPEIMRMTEFLETRLRQARTHHQDFDVRDDVPQRGSKSIDFVSLDGVRWSFLRGNFQRGNFQRNRSLYPTAATPYWALAFPGVAPDDAAALCRALLARQPQWVEQHRRRLGGSLVHTRRVLRDTRRCTEGHLSRHFPSAAFEQWQQRDLKMAALWEAWDEATDLSLLRRLRFQLLECADLELQEVGRRIDNCQSVEELEELYLLLGYQDRSLLQAAWEPLVERQDLSAMVAWLGATTLLDPPLAAANLGRVLSDPQRWQGVAGESWPGVHEWLEQVASWVALRQQARGANAPL